MYLRHSFLMGKTQAIEFLSAKNYLSLSELGPFSESSTLLTNY